MTKATSETGGITRYAYDETGKLQSVTDPAGNTVSYTYNEAGELIRETDSEGHSLSYEYNALGQPVRITDALGRETIHTYEKGGRLLKTTYPNGREISYTYDNNGNVKTKENSDGYRLTYTYDCMNRVEKVTSSNGQEKSYTYDIMGNVTSMTDANGNTTAYEYTLGGKLSAVTDALGNRTQYRYDALDNLILIERMGEGKETERKTEYIRNPLGQVETVRDVFGKEERYTYDAFGRMREKTDRDGYKTAFTYEPDGKTKSILYADGKSVEMEYDALRRLICVRDWLGTTRIDRDDKGQIEAVTDHTGKTVTYRYGKMGERTGITYPDGKSVTYRYDEQMRLAEMQIPYGTDETEGKSITYRYDESGRISEKHFPDGMRTLWHYGENGELTELIHEDREGVLDRYGYEYDLMGNKTAITKERRGLEEESGRYEYGYDALSRLATVTKDGEALRSYAYDPFGNRSTMEDHKAGRKTAYAYDALDRLTGRREAADGKESIREYLYDNRGNLTEEKEDGRLLHGYAYDARNRLERAWDAAGAEAVYEYNGLGQRTAKQTGEGREAYLLDLTKPYHNLLGMVRGDNERSFYWDGNAAAMAEKDELHYYLQDELGSPVRVSGYDKDYLTYGYDEFGNDLHSDLEEAGIPNPYSRQGEEQPFGYTGYRYDGISGTYFAQAREYQPQNGRFTAEDVIKGNGAVPDTFNRYGYCWGNPIKYIDTNGESPITQREANEIIWNYYMKEVNRSYTAIEAKVKNSIDSITDTIDNRIQSVKDAGETIKNECNALYAKASYVWNNHIRGKDTTIVYQNQPPIMDPVLYYKQIVSKTDHTGPNIIVQQVTTGQIDSVGVTIGIPKIFNIGGSIGSEGLDISLFLGVEDVIESYLNINIGSSSIVEIDSKLEAGWNGNMGGIGASFGVSPDSDVKLYTILKNVDENGINTYEEVGIHIKTEYVYALAILLAMPAFELESIATYILEILGVKATLFGACDL